MTWIPTGPTSVRDGSPPNVPVAGRATDLAVSADGLRVYAATATGGVWRSDDGGARWTPLTDALDAHPTSVHTCSLSCGAIAIDPMNRDRVFVGTGEPRWYGGVGVLYSETAGAGWTVESADASSPALMGQMCAAIVIDPNMPDRAVAVFNNGVYRREPDGASGFHWVLTAGGTGFTYCDGVVAASGGLTTFYVARTAYAPDADHVQAVLQSNDGAAWTAVGAGFPATGVANFALAVQPHNPNLIYALTLDWSATSGSLLRLDLPDANWGTVGDLPPIFTNQNDLCCAVDPVDPNVIFVASVLAYRCVVSPGPPGMGPPYTLVSTDVNFGTHVDFHRFRYVGSDSNKLWAANDGGAFFTANALTGPAWRSCSIGLATMQPNALDVHPTQDAVIFIATQDNGTVRSFGDEVWFGLTNMDGAWVIINWANPYKILTGIGKDVVWRATDGAATSASWDVTTSLPLGSIDSFVPFAATPPYDPGNPADADIVAVAGRAVWLTRDFGTSWHSIPNGDPSDELAAGDEFAGIAFSGANRLFAVSRYGVVRRYDFDGTVWHVSDLALDAGVPSFASIAVDYNDPARLSCYVALSSSPTFARVRHYDGTAWSLRSGPAADDPAAIRSVPCNAIATDPNHPLDVYTACDVGVWRSRNAGATWAPLNDGLPQAPIPNLKIHPTFPTLYAAVYGRGVYEYDLTGAPPPAAQLYIRDTLWDTGKRPTADGLTAPADPARHLYHWDGPDIRVDAPAADGSYQFPTPDVSPYDFIVSLIDKSGSAETADPSAPPVIDRVYVRVHNRGSSPVNDAVLTLLLAPASPALPDLPSGYTSTVQTGAALGASPWHVVGRQTLPGVAIGAPVVVEFDLPSTMLPPPVLLPGASHYCLLAVVHSASLDAFTSTEQHVDTLTTQNRKATNKNLTVVPMAVSAGGTPAPHLVSPWVPVRLHGSSRGLGPLRLDTRNARGFVDVVVPDDLIPHHARSSHAVENASALTALKEAAARSHVWLSQHQARAPYDPRYMQQTREHLERILHGTGRALRVRGASLATLFEQLPLRHSDQHELYLRFALPAYDAASTRIIHLFHEGKPLGGITYELRMPAARRQRELNTKPRFRANDKIV